MKKIFTISLFIALAIQSLSQSNDFYQKTDAFLKQHVASGLINYDAIHKEPVELEALMAQIVTYNLAGKSKEEHIAFYINAYNLLVIHAIVKAYPVRSPNDVRGFFTTQKHQVARMKITLNELEKDLLEKYSNAQYHFALVCGARGCPPLIAEAYQPGKLTDQLERQTRLAVDNPLFTEVDEEKKKVRLSQIFNWYKADFKDEGGWRAFINRYRHTPIPDDYSAAYDDYDWTLNGQTIPTDTEKSGPKNSLQAYRAGTLLRPGQIESKGFYNLYTQNQFFNDQRKQAQGGRSNFLTAISTFMYGIKPGLNIGLELYHRSTSNRASNTTPFDVLRFQNSPEARSAFTQLGPKFRYAPFKINGLSVQTTLLFPLSKDLQGRFNEQDPADNRPYLDHDGYQIFQQFFYDKLLGTSFNLFVEASAFIRIDRRFDKDNYGFTTPVKGFLSYFITPRFTSYAMSEFAPGWNGSFYVQSGLGFKYQVTERNEIELLYTNFWLGRNGGAGQTLNVGLRYLH